MNRRRESVALNEFPHTIVIGVASRMGQVNPPVYAYH